MLLQHHMLRITRLYQPNMSPDHDNLCESDELLSHFPFCQGTEKSWDDLVATYISKSSVAEKTLYEYVERCPRILQTKLLHGIRHNYESDFPSPVQKKKLEQRIQMMVVAKQTPQSSKFIDPAQAPYWMYLGFGSKTLENAGGCLAINGCMSRHNMTIPQILYQLNVKYHNDHDMVAHLRSLLEQLDEEPERALSAADERHDQASGYDHCECDSRVHSSLEKCKNRVLDDKLLQDAILSLKASSPSVTDEMVNVGLDIIRTKALAATDVQLRGPLTLWMNDIDVPTWRNSLDSVLIADVVEPIVPTGNKHPWVLFFVYFGPKTARGGPTTIRIFDFDSLQGIDFQKSIDRIRKLFGIREVKRHQHSMTLPVHVTDNFKCHLDPGLCVLFMIETFLEHQVHTKSPEMLQNGRPEWVRNLRNSFEKFNPCTMKSHILDLIDLKYQDQRHHTIDKNMLVIDHSSQSGQSSTDTSIGTFWTQPQQNKYFKEMRRSPRNSPRNQRSDTESCVPSSSQIVLASQTTCRRIYGEGDQRPEFQPSSGQWEHNNLESLSTSQANRTSSRRACQSVSRATSSAAGQRESSVVKTSATSRTSGLNIRPPFTKDDRNIIVPEMSTRMFYGNTPPSAQVPESSGCVPDLESSEIQSRKRSRSKSREAARSSKRCKDVWSLASPDVGLQAITACSSRSESQDVDSQAETHRVLELEMQVKILQEKVQEKDRILKMMEGQKGAPLSTILVSSNPKSTSNYRPARR